VRAGAGRIAPGHPLADPVVVGHGHERLPESSRAVWPAAAYFFSASLRKRKWETTAPSSGYRQWRVASYRLAVPPGKGVRHPEDADHPDGSHKGRILLMCAVIHIR
jgi:hypothetical protein